MEDRGHPKRSLRLIALIALFTLGFAFRCSYLTFGLPRWPTGLEATLLQDRPARAGTLPANEHGPGVHLEDAEPRNSPFKLPISPFLARCFSVLLSTASVVLVWFFVRKLWSETTAYLAAALLVVHPGAVFNRQLRIQPVQQVSAKF